MSIEITPVTEALTAAYGLLGENLAASGLLGDHWKPNRRLDPPASEADRLIVEIFVIVRRALRSYTPRLIAKAADRPIEAIRALPEGENHGNIVLTALHLLAMMAAEYPGPTMMMLRTKTARAIDMVSPEVRTTADDDTARQSYRIADNLWRYLNDRPMLDNALRDLWTGRYLKKRRGNQ